jgi:hypothetical protein
VSTQSAKVTQTATAEPPSSVLWKAGLEPHQRALQLDQTACVQNPLEGFPCIVVRIHSNAQR